MFLKGVWGAKSPRKNFVILRGFSQGFLAISPLVPPLLRENFGGPGAEPPGFFFAILGAKIDFRKGVVNKEERYHFTLLGVLSHDVFPHVFHSTCRNE